jgi:hypothetical protein
MGDVRMLRIAHRLLCRMSHPQGSATSEDARALRLAVALRADRDVAGSAFVLLSGQQGEAHRAPRELLRTEMARYLQRQAERRHPGVRTVFAALDLEGDRGVLVRRMTGDLRGRLGRGAGSGDVDGAALLAAAESDLVSAATRELRTALADRRVARRLVADPRPGAARRIPAAIFDQPDPVAALRHLLAIGA